MTKKLAIEDNTGQLQRQVDVDDTTKTLKIYDGNDTEVMDLENHAQRHVFGGSDALPSGALDYTQMISDTIQIKIPVTIPDSVQSSLAADSTGVKYTSAFKFRIPARHVKDIVVRSTWTASATDSVTEIDLIDESSGNIIASVSGNAETDIESSNYNSANLTDDGLTYVQAQITTASATTGATFDIAYITVEIRLGVS